MNQITQVESSFRPVLPVTVGLDLGDRESHFALLQPQGEPQHGTVATTPEALRELFADLKGRGVSHIGFEVGTHSPWVDDLAQEYFAQVIVTDPATVKQHSPRGKRKTDRNDAETLARLVRLYVMDPKVLRRIVHRPLASRMQMALVRTRDNLVRQRTGLVNEARGTVKSLGERLASCDAKDFVVRMRADAPVHLRSMLEHLLVVIDALNREITALDRKLEAVANENPVVAQLRSVYGVGTITALSFVLVVQSPTRFADTRDVGAYLGLCPGRKQSGASDPQMRITKTGDGLVRRLLVMSAQCILRNGAKDSDLRRFGTRLAERGGKAARKRAVVAVARKLAVLLLALWKSGSTYDALRNSNKGEAAPTEAAD